MSKTTKLQLPSPSIYVPYQFEEGSDFISKFNTDFLESRKYTIDELKLIGEKLPQSNAMKKNPSRGFISLLDYINNQQNFHKQSPKKLIRNGSKSNYSSPKSELKVVSQTTFRTTKIIKDLGLWDDNSEEAFRNRVISLFNRITKSNINSSVKELESILKNPAQIDFAAKLIVSKAGQEHLFSTLYGEFCSHLSMSDLKNSILSEAKTQFLKCSESINNNSVHFAVGYSKFLSSLIYHNLIPNDEGNHFLDILLSHIERDGVKEQYVDMLSSFVAGVGRDFTKKVPTSLWNRFDSIISQKLPSRLHFLLKDVEEIRNQWLYDIPINVHSTNVAQIDENLKKVRDSLMNYLEGDEAICDLEPNDFIVSVCKMLPDQTGSDSYVFVEFVCDVLESKKPIQDKINRTLSMFARSYRENSIESDSPKTWSVFDDMLYLMMLRDILQVNEVKSVMLQFPDNHSSDVNNGMKWFLYDHWDFTSPVHSKNFLSNEIADALAMPSTIEEHNNHRIYMSRLIAISIVRSVIAKVSVEENPLEAMKKYRGFLAQVMRKEKDVFDDEITQAIEIYEFGFGLMDVQKLVEDV